MKRYLLIALLAAAIMATGCAKESDLPNPTGTGTVRAINAIPTSPDIRFLIEERLISNVSFKNQSDSQDWDDLDYTFNFDVRFGGDAEFTRVASQYIDVIADTDYTMLVSGALDAPDITVWETASREWDGTETVFEIRFANASPSIGAVDVYLLDPGSLPVLGNQVGTIANTEITTAIDVEAADKIIFFTPAGDDSTILFESSSLGFIEGSAYLCTIFEGDANEVSPIAVRLMNTTVSTIGRLTDVNASPTARFYHASTTAGDADIYFEETLTMPVLTGHTFGDVSGDIEIPSGEVTLTYTAAGNSGSLIYESTRNIANGTRNNYYLARTQDGIEIVTTAFLDRRLIETQARFSLAHVAADHPVVSVYIVPTGEGIEDTLPVLPALLALIPPISIPLPEGDYDVYVTALDDENEQIVLLGPEPLSMVLGTFVESVLYDTVDPNVPAFVIIPPP